MTRFSLSLVALKHNYFPKNHEPVPSSCENTAIDFLLHTFFKHIQNTGKCILKVEIVTYQREMTEQSSRCSLPTGAKASDQKSENVKSLAMSMTTYDPIFVIIGRIKPQLFPQKPRTCAIPLRSYINFIVGPSGPNQSIINKIVVT